MTAPIWLTPAGDLGIIPEQEYYDLALDAYNTSGGSLTYTLIAGNLPQGLQLQSTGEILGIPVNGELSGVPSAVSKVVTSNFAIRITNILGEIADRTFNLTVAGLLPPVIVPAASDLGTYIDGQFIDLQLDAQESNSLLTATFSLVDGELPPGISFTSNGRIYGYISPTPSPQTGDDSGYDATNYDVYGYDFLGINVNKNFQFTVEASDGINVSTKTYNIFVYARQTLTADNGDITADNDLLITADVTTTYNPILYTEAGGLGNVRQNTNFAYQFDAVDFNGDTLTYNLASGTLPTGLTLNSTNGWITGYVPFGPLGSSTFSFTVNVTKNINGNIYASETKSFSLKLLGQIDDEVVWVSNADLGRIYNGDISELFISAYTTSGRSLNYRLQTLGAMPIGVELLIDGTISGRVSFETFSLDSDLTDFDTDTTTWDQVYTFTAEAYDSAGYVFSEKTFTITVSKRDFKPYENLSIQLLVNRQQRAYYDDIINNSDIFPPSYIYRPYDPWYGKNTSRRSLFITGLNAEIAANYINAMSLNHYWKTLTFGEVKTAQALDDNFEVKYEVVYIELVDQGVNAQGLGPALAITWPTNTQNISTVYTNSFPNMAQRVGDGVGYENRSVIPDWMTSRQTDGAVLGFTRCLILCYAVPGRSNEIAYRVQQVYDNFNLIDFTVDRYEWDQVLSDNFRKEPYQGNGTIQTSTTSNVVLGTGSDFLNQPGFVPGQTIFVSNTSIGNISFVSNATYLTLTTNAAATYASAIYTYSTNIFLVNNFTIGTGTISCNTSSNVVQGISSNITGTGTITGNTSSKTITGNGTSFSTELQVGKILYYANTVIGTINTISSANVLTVVDLPVAGFSNAAFTAQGVSTRFVDEIHVGDTLNAIISNSNVVIGTVASITSNTSLVLSSNAVTTQANVSYNHTARDPYTTPGLGNQYLKFPQYNILA